MTEEKGKDVCSGDSTATNVPSLCRRAIAIPEDGADNSLSKSGADDQQCEENSTEENSMENSKIVFLADKESVSSKSVTSSSCKVPESSGDDIEKTQEVPLKDSEDSLSSVTICVDEETPNAYLIGSGSNSSSSTCSSVAQTDKDEYTQTTHLLERKDLMFNSSTNTTVAHTNEDVIKETKTSILHEKGGNHSSSSRLNEVLRRHNDITCIDKSQEVVQESREDSSWDSAPQDCEDVKEATQKLLLNDSKGSNCKAPRITGVTKKGEDFVEEIEENNTMKKSETAISKSSFGNFHFSSSDEDSNSNHTQCREVTISIPEKESDTPENICECHEVSRSTAEGADENKETLNEEKLSETLPQSKGENVTNDVPDKVENRLDELYDQKCPLVPEDKPRVPTLERLDRVHQESLPSYSKNSEIAVTPETQPQDYDSHLVKWTFVDPKQHREQIDGEPYLRADTESQTDQALNHMRKVGNIETSTLLRKGSNGGHQVQQHPDLQIDKNLHRVENKECFENEEVSPDIRSERGAQVGDNLKDVDPEGTSVNDQLFHEKNNSLSGRDSPIGTLPKRKCSESSVDKQDTFIETETGEEETIEVKFDVGKIRKRGIWYYSKNIVFDGIRWQVVVGRHAGDKVFIGLCPVVSDEERYLEYEVDYIIKLVNDQHGNRSVRKDRVHTFTSWGVQGLFEFLPWRELIDENSGFVDCDNLFRINVMIKVIYMYK